MARKDANPGKKETQAERRAKAVAYRKAGMPVRDIAIKLGVSHTTILKDINAVMNEVNEKTLNDAKELQALQWERCEMALVGIATKVAKGELGAIDRWNNVIITMNRLKGLNEPAESAFTLRTPLGGFDLKKLQNLTPEQLDQFEQLMMVMNSGEDDTDDGARDEE